MNGRFKTMNQLLDVRTAVMTAGLTLGLNTGAMAQPVTEIGMDPKDSTFGRKEFSPYLNQNFPQRVFWGETPHPGHRRAGRTVSAVLPRGC